MTQEELKKIGCGSIEDMIAEDFGEVGTPERDALNSVVMRSLLVNA